MPRSPRVTRSTNRRNGARGDALLAEVAVERLLRRHRCDFEREVPLPNGRTADFRVERNRTQFHLHVKWLSAPTELPRATPIPRELRAFERLARPIEVAVRWKPGAGCTRYRRMVRELTPFLRSARISEERLAHDASGGVIGAARVIGPAPRGGGLRLVDARLVDRRAQQAGRAMRLLRKAVLQFMPRSTNVILIVSADPLDGAAIESALLGTMVERWDRFPARGERTAIGRGDDGFWSRGGASQSRVAAWLRAGDPPSGATRRLAAGPLSGQARSGRSALWFRDGSRVPESVAALLCELFDR